TKASVVITINGTNDVPTLSTGVAAVTEDVGVVGGKLVTSGSVMIADIDTGESSFQAGATFTSSTGGTQLGTLVFNTDGSYSYAVDNSLVQYLKTGESVIETYTVTSKDGSATTTITITINGTDDGAVIAPSKPGDDEGLVQEDVTLTANGKLDVTDPDEDQAEFTPVTAYAGQYGDFSIDKNGNWTFDLNNGNATVQALGVGEHLTDTFTVTTIDGTTAQVTITIDGSNDKPVLSGALTGTVTEDGTQSAIGQLATTDVDVNDTHSYSVVGASTGTYGSFSVDASGQWTYQLDNAAAQSLKTGDTRTETYQVQVSDGQGGVDTKDVTITINGTDDGAVITPSKPGDDKGTVQEDGLLTASGKLDVTDPDKDQAEFTPVTAYAGQYGDFSIDKNGNWTFDLKNGNATVQALGVGEHLTDTFTVTTIDGTTAQITITIDGTNDKPVLSGALTGTVTEDGTQSAIGQLSTTDVDVNDTHSYSVVGASTGTYGSFSVDASGQWTYQLDNAAAQSLKTGDTRTETYQVQVSDGKGGVDTKDITITINGVDDGATISPSVPGADKGTVQEDVTLSASGKLDVTDPDAGQAEFTPVAGHAGQYGDFSIDKNGNWTFDLNNGNATVQALGVGEHLTDTFTVTTIDGTTAQVTITINGTNDDPKLSGVLTGTVTEDGTKTAIGQLATTDVDINDTHSYSVVGASTGAYGSFSVDASGQWTYLLDNAAAQSLKTGDTRTETYQVQVSDGKGGADSKTITITINGTDDGAVIAPSKPGDDAGLVQEDVTLTASGKLDVTDPDAGQAEFKPQTDAAGQYGSFSVDKNGNWKFNLDNDNATVQALGVGEHLTDTFTVTTIDGTTAQITITINGTNDKPVLSGALTGTVTEDGTQSAIGQLATTDVDTN
ncbi:VCBS domain-containing protein, partial [Pantoea sp. 18069]|uniref:VCBS domain-containing protein n=1 Tax=Pantoea sp. 18069 TaxID=2681415 RepID=UPI00190F6757